VPNTAIRRFQANPDRKSHQSKTKNADDPKMDQNRLTC